VTEETDILRGMRTGWIAVVIVMFAAACGDNKKFNGPQDAGIDTSRYKCGNGVVDDPEQCDDGDANGGQDARCTTDCRWVCSSDAECTDGDPCNGTDTCVDHVCVTGAEQPDGTTCGDAKLCRNGSCTDAVCGDSFTTTPGEECDDSNSNTGDGCENNCKYSCVSTDTTRNCTPIDPCQGQGACNDTTHVCAAGTPLGDNTSCGNGNYCKTGVCTTPMCGNGMVEPGETCDLGASNGTMGSGCKANCTYECVNAATDCPATTFCNMNTCNTAHACAAVADTAKNGMSCGTNLVCNNGNCVAPTAVCGNGVKETGEACDFGTGNGSNTGCTNCQFSCTLLPDSCNDGNLCNGTETCSAVTVNGQAGQKCNQTATAPAAGTTCATGKICLNQLCVTSVCGDGILSTVNGEQCEPPNTATCSATCQNIVCGDGVRAGTEQCDDSNTTNLDGCNSTCKFEQCHRVNQLTMQFVKDPVVGGFCTINQLGAAIVGSTARSQLATALTDGVNDGSITISLAALGLTDLGGTSGTFSLGVLTGTPVTGTTTYNGASDLDWWYTTAASVIDAMRNPMTTISAALVSKELTGGPSDISISISLGGSPAVLNMLRARLRGNVGASSKPLTSTGGTPGHLAAEHLDPALVSFATVTGGKLCGDVTAKSLAAVPAPSALVGCGLLNCSKCYTASNTLLDIIIGGCSVLGVKQIEALQPDQARVPADAGKYIFTVNTTSKAVTGCTKNGVVTALATCLNDAAYSSYFTFTTDRVIMK
jgi:cysteine-rich repeat protein